MPTQSTPATPTLTELLFHRAAVGLCLVGPDGTILRANPEWLRSTGLSLVQVLGKDITGLFAATDELSLALQGRARAGPHVEVSRHARQIDGRETWWEGSVDPVSMEAGVGLLVTAREVTLPTSAPGLVDFSQHEGDERFRLLADAMAQIVCVLEPDGTARYVNFAWTAFSGLDLRATIRAGWTGVLHPDDLAAARDCRRRAIKSLAPQDVELRYRAAGGGYRCFLSRLAPVVERGRVIRFVGAAMDIEDRLRAERDLKRREEEAQRQAAELKAVLDAVPAAVFITRDREAREMDANRFSSELLRVPAGSNVSKSAPEGKAPRSFRTMRGAVEIPPERLPLQLAAATGEEVRGYELDLVFDDGEVRHLLGNATPMREPDGTPGGAVGAFVDITERKRVEEALRNSEERVRAAFEASPDAININRMRDGVYVAVNDAFVRFSGWGREDVVGKTALELNIWVDREERARFLDRLSAGEPVQSLQTMFRRRDGTVFSAAISARSYLVDGERFLLAITHDISKLKQVEAALRDADRRKDEFLGLLSHELRNPLAPIRSAAYVLERADPGSVEAERARGALRRQTEHLTRLVDDLLDVTRITRGKIALQRSRIDLREVVLRAAEDIRPTMAERGIAFRTVLPDGAVWGHADATRLNQVVANLLHNASKFTRRGDEVVVSLRSEGSAVEIRVRDTGAGIDATVLPHIFDAFVQADRTLARSEGGLGLGLALVKVIAELHGGEVRAESGGIGKGTEFVVRIPLQEVVTPAAQPDGGLPQQATNRRRVLVVDDNKDAAEVLADILRMSGHAVEVAHDGPAALEKARSGTPDVVLCDIGLPGMNGYDVARAMRANGDRSVRLVALTGYAQPEDVRRAMEAGFDAHVAKPPDPAEIARLLA